MSSTRVNSDTHVELFSVSFKPAVNKSEWGGRLGWLLLTVTDGECLCKVECPLQVNTHSSVIHTAV